MRKYPTVPINIEIKGRSDGDLQSFTDNAEALAATLDRLGRTEGIVVASFNDAAIARFQRLAPEIDLAPSISETAAFKFGGVPPGPGKVAFQVPITFSGQQVVDEDFVESSHENGLAVHVWLSNDPENDATYRQLLEWDVDAVMPAAPAAFERVLCAGHVRLRVAGEAERARFDFGRFKPSEGGPTKETVDLDLSRRVARKLAERPRRAKVSSRAFQAYGGSARFELSH